MEKIKIGSSVQLVIKIEEYKLIVDCKVISSLNLKEGFTYFLSIISPPPSTNMLEFIMVLRDKVTVLSRYEESESSNPCILRIISQTEDVISVKNIFDKDLLESIMIFYQINLPYTDRRLPNRELVEHLQRNLTYHSRGGQKRSISNLACDEQDGLVMVHKYLINAHDLSKDIYQPVKISTEGEISCLESHDLSVQIKKWVERNLC